MLRGLCKLWMESQVGAATLKMCPMLLRPFAIDAY